MLLICRCLDLSGSVVLKPFTVFLLTAISVFTGFAEEAFYRSDGYRPADKPVLRHLVSIQAYRNGYTPGTGTMAPRLGWAPAALLFAGVFWSKRTFAVDLVQTVDIAVGFKEPPCWKTGGLHELPCYHADPLLFETYPFTPEMLTRAINRYPTTDLSLHRAFQRARDAGVLKVVVLGGSVTCGHQCETPGGQSGKECAWPKRLQQWFDERVEDFTVEVRHVTTGLHPRTLRAQPVLFTTG